MFSYMGLGSRVGLVGTESSVWQGWDTAYRKVSHLLADWWRLFQGGGFPPEVGTGPSFFAGPAMGWGMAQDVP